MNNIYNSKQSMKHPVLIILLSIILIGITTLMLPWYTKVVPGNYYFYSVSKAGAQITGSLPVTLALGVLLLMIILKPQQALNGIRLKFIFFTGLWITIYSSFYYCAVTSSPYTTPGFGALVAVVGGVVLMLICITKYTRK